MLTFYIFINSLSRRSCGAMSMEIMGNITGIWLLEDNNNKKKYYNFIMQ